MKKILSILLLLIPITLSASEFNVKAVYKKVDISSNQIPYDTYILDGKKPEKFEIPNKLFLTPIRLDIGTYEVRLEQVENSLVWHVLNSDIYIEFIDSVFAPSYISLSAYKTAYLKIESNFGGGIFGIGKVIVD